MDPFNRGPHSNVTHTHHHHRRNSDEDEQQYPPPGNSFSPFNNSISQGGSISLLSITLTTHHHHQHNIPNPSAPPVSNINKRTFRVITKADPNYSLTVRSGEIVLAPSNPTDQYQHWYKDEKFSTRVKDSEGYPAFSLVNKVTGEAIKHSIGAGHPVRLIRYNPDYLDESILWTESRDLGGGYRTIRMVNNVKLNVDAFHGDKLSGGVHDGTTIVLWDWNKGDNQQWKILPY